MKLPLFCLAVAFCVAGFRTNLCSQDAAPVNAPAPAPVAAIPNGPPLQMLRAIRDGNIKLLEQQSATLQKLEEMERNSQTLKVLGKRS